MHGNTVHSSAPNTSELRRAALTLRYIPVSTRVTNQARSTSYLWMAAGEPDPRINYYHSWPKYLKGYHPKFPGCESWNDRRRVNFLDEANFVGPAERQIEAGERRAREDVADVMETLAKGKRSAVAAEGKADRRFRADSKEGTGLQVLSPSTASATSTTICLFFNVVSVIPLTLAGGSLAPRCRNGGRKLK